MTNEHFLPEVVNANLFDVGELWEKARRRAVPAGLVPVVEIRGVSDSGTLLIINRADLARLAKTI